MTGAGVFTNPANIMPTREASILIDTDVQAAAAQDATHRLGMQPAGASILHAVLEQKAEGRGSRVTSTTNASGRNASFEGDLLAREHPEREHQVAQQLPGRHPAHGAGGSRHPLGIAAAQVLPGPVPPLPPLAPEAETRVALETHDAQLGLAHAERDAGSRCLECARGGGHRRGAVPTGPAQRAHGCAVCSAGKYGELLGVDGVCGGCHDTCHEQLCVFGRFVLARDALQPESKASAAKRALQHQLKSEYVVELTCRIGVHAAMLRSDLVHYLGTIGCRCLENRRRPWLPVQYCYDAVCVGAAAAANAYDPAQRFARSGATCNPVLRRCVRYLCDMQHDSLQRWT
ncbi:hypothetical protein ON010_g18561 [Phytophthora cinnamomi]|nr:hypothetical protein ON010_g18561 [Phytophthora cinnamomi]